MKQTLQAVQQLHPDTHRSMYTELEIEYDEEYRLAWYYMHAKPRLCCSPTLISEIQQWYGELISGSYPYDVRYIVLASKVPGVFNLGGDLNLFIELIRNGDRDGLMHYATSCIDTLFLHYTHLGKDITTITLVQGDALGGGLEYAISSDVLIAERSAKMGMPEILFNLFPGMGAYSFLSRKVGAVQAERMILGGCLYSAEQLHEMGIVDVLVEDGQGEQAVLDYIHKEERAQNGYRAFRQAKQYCNPVSYAELENITTAWVDAAVRLEDKSLRMMERLISRQSARSSRSQEPAGIKGIVSSSGQAFLR
ncbi:MAG: crotonase/enoyl-CoA hydratase family protein [Desulfuromusa sp.]|nr:crotonase/enoyl-CoA hydratase family protein [Desulfuromusa sp.]